MSKNTRFAGFTLPGFLVVPMLLLASVMLFAQPPSPTGSEKIALGERLFNEANAMNPRNPESNRAAREKLEEALRLFRETGERRKEAVCLLTIGQFYFIYGDPKKALEYYEPSLAILEALSDARAAVVLNGIGDIYAAGGNFEKALGFYELGLLKRRTAGDRRGEFVTLRKISAAYIKIGDKVKALERLNQALALSRTLGDKQGEAAITGSLAFLYYEAGDFKKALESFEFALPQIQESGDKLTEASALMAIGDLYVLFGENKKALEHLEKSAAISSSNGYKPLEAGSLVAIGNIYLAFGQHKAALGFSLRSLAAAGEARIPGLEYLALVSLGQIYAELGDVTKALDHLDRAFKGFTATNDKQHAAISLAGTGSVYYALGDYKKALAYFAMAFPLSQAAGDRLAEADILTHIGNVFFMTGENARALENLNTARSILKTSGMSAREGATMVTMGNIYMTLGNASKGLSFYEEALSLIRRSSDKVSEASALTNLGNAYYSVGDYTKALDYFTQALEVSGAVGDKTRQSGSLSGAGIVFLARGDKASALDYFQRALALSREFGDRTGEGIALTNIGYAYYALENYDKVSEYLNQALTIFRATGDRSHEAMIFGDLMVLQNKLKNTRLAVLYGKRSIDLYQEMRTAIVSLDKNTRKTYRKMIEEPYRFLADLLISLGRIAEAEQVLGKLKEDEVFSYLRRDDKVAKDLLKNVSLTEDERLALKRYNDLAEQISKIGKEFRDLDTERKAYDNPAQFPRQARFDELKKQLADASLTFQKFLDELKITFGRTDGRVDAVDSGLKAMLQRLKAPRTVIVSTILGESRLNIIVTTADVQRAHTIDKSQKEIGQIIIEFRQALTDPSIDPRPFSQKLYDILVKPIEKDLEGISADTIVWSLDGALRYIPPAALWDKDKGYLVERFSSAVITLAGSRTIEPPPGDKQKMNALGVGVSKSVEGFTALTAVPDELDCIITDAQGKTVSANPKCQNGVMAGKKLLDENFTLSTFEDALGRYPVVHIASHFSLNPGNDRDSFLLLGGGANKRYTIENLRAAPLAEVDLIVLSACNTATPGGEKTNGVEIEGFGAAAQQQGAKAVIASLWSVADDSTRELMVRFYGLYGKTGLSKTEALRQAQLSMLSGNYKPGDPNARRDSKKIDLSGEGPARLPFKKDDNAPYAHPYFWSPFVLMGNWR